MFFISIFRKALKREAQLKRSNLLVYLVKVLVCFENSTRIAEQILFFFNAIQRHFEGQNTS